MATDDQQRLVTGSAPAPANFKIPGNGQMRPKSVFATFDGTGAAGSYKPALKVISDAGEVVGIYDTDTSVAAGASADVTWFPGLGGAAGSPPVPGQILSVFSGLSTVADFTTNSGVFVDTGFPVNATLNKVSGTSALLIVLLGDMTSGAAPDCLFLGTFIDGVNYATTGVHVSLAGTFITAPATAYQGFGVGIDAPLSAGPHTVKVRTACLAGVNFTVRTSTSVGLSIIEVEP